MKINQKQSVALFFALLNHFETWKAERLQARENHIGALIKASTHDAIRLCQDSIQAIDRQIDECQTWYKETLRVLDSQTDYDRSEVVPDNGG